MIKTKTLILFEKAKNLFQKNNAKLNLFLIVGIMFFAIPFGSLLSTEFTNEPSFPPNTPQCVSPYHGSFDVDTTTYLEWNCNDPDNDIIQYLVYFGKNNDPSQISTQTKTKYHLSDLEYETTYFWKITVSDEQGNSKTSPVFNFTTKQNISTDETKKEENHTVFVEFGASVWGQECPRIKNILYDLYDDENLDFKYVTMVSDENDKAHTRLFGEYNIHDFPTTYIDAGFYVFDMNSEKTYEKNDFKDKISAAMNREKTSVSIDVECIFDDVNNEFETTVTAYNDENEKYSGRLRVYLVEKISQWYDYEGKPYHFAFIDYVINEDVVIATQDKIVKSKQWPVDNSNHENLQVIAVLFTDKPIEKDSNPSNPSHYHGFQAYYSEATAFADVGDSDDLPPQIGIEYPKKLRINIFGRAKFMDPFWKNTILIGRTTIKTVASDDSQVEKVEFYIDGELKETVTQEPYEYTFRKIGLIKKIVRKHTITVTAYDDSGKTSSANLDVLTFFL